MSTRINPLVADRFTTHQSLYAPGKQLTWTGVFDLKESTTLWELEKCARYVLTAETDVTVTLPVVDTFLAADGDTCAGGHDVWIVNRGKQAINVINSFGASIAIVEAAKNCKIVASDTEAKKWFVESKTSALDPNDVVQPSFQEVYGYSEGSDPSIQLTKDLGGFTLMDSPEGLDTVFSVQTGNNFTLINAGNTADGVLKPALSMLGGTALGDKSFALGEGAIASGDNAIVLSAGMEINGSDPNSLTFGAQSVRTAFGVIGEGLHNTSPYYLDSALIMESVVPTQLTETKFKTLDKGTIYHLEITALGNDKIVGSDGLFEIMWKGTVAISSEGKLIKNAAILSQYAYPGKVDKFIARMNLRLDGDTLMLGLACADSVSEGELGSCRANVMYRYSSLTIAA